VDATTVNRWATDKVDVPQYAIAYLEAIAGDRIK
jgi:hypothetical protein